MVINRLLDSCAIRPSDRNQCFSRTPVGPAQAWDVLDTASGRAATCPSNPCRIFQIRARGVRGVRILSKPWKVPRRLRYLGNSRPWQLGTFSGLRMRFTQINGGRCVIFLSSGWYYGADIRGKVASPTCGICSVTLARPFVCLHCPYSACWTKGHILGHLRHTGHFFCEPWIEFHFDLGLTDCPRR